MDNTINEELLKRITINPEISFGKPCVGGMRFAVIYVLELVDAGMTDKEIPLDYSYLEQEDLDACRLYRAKGFPLENSAMEGE